jgi:hypothetical protein
MDATPLEQVDVVDVAAYETDEPTVEPFAGLLTVTLAHADADRRGSRKSIERGVFTGPA